MNRLWQTTLSYGSNCFPPSGELKKALNDPMLGRMLCADPVLQSPGNLQNYNRYSYVLNNPLKYTDPSGYIYRQKTEADAWAEAMQRRYGDFSGGGSGGSVFPKMGTPERDENGRIIAPGPVNYYNLEYGYMKWQESFAGSGDCMAYTGGMFVYRPKNSKTTGSFERFYGSNPAEQWGRFPLDERVNSYLEYPGRFGDPRNGGSRKHGGADLYSPVGTNVYAVKDGTVIQNPYKFYRGSYAIEVNHGNFIARYSEINIASGLRAGSFVSQGQILGTVADLSLKLSMLHFEMYSGSETGPLTNRANLPYMRRNDLIDPTHFLNFGF